MMTYKDAEVRLADNISYEEFVPDSEDFVRVREQMKKEVQKVLVQYYNIFKNLDVVEQHQYSSITIQKSEIVSVTYLVCYNLVARITTSISLFGTFCNPCMFIMSQVLHAQQIELTCRQGHQKNARE